MSVIYVLIPIAIVLLVIAIGVFFWAVKSNQFDDLERHGHSILFDDDLEKTNTKAQTTKPQQEQSADSTTPKNSSKND